ncbi:hypothetical protein BV22DRAFT_1029556 [Leucogyrophana mollusca]|uniref:Uncharacterized protein n=1 Tax=Leucogyrophana mollusca TaxID=85980 RepID=A0ACB8BXX2_9AGAM|nr:hypothetical protein BV22DRAFT_1029556 [Leucogyrophana mollusca]
MIADGENKVRVHRGHVSVCADIGPGPSQTPAGEAIPNDLNGVVPGLKRLKSDLVSGEELVIHPWEA